MVIRTFLIEDYIKRIIMSKSRRKKYYTKDKPVPKRYGKDPKKYQFIKGVLYDMELGEKIIKNKRTAGTPKYHKISGNDMWAGVSYHLRSKISSEMKTYFYEYFRGAEPLLKSDYPVGISITVTDNVFGRNGEDIDNMSYLYRKTILDALRGNVEFVKNIGDDGKVSYVPDYEKYPPILEDDSREFITEMKTKLICKDIPNEETSILIEIYNV